MVAPLFGAVVAGGSSTAASAGAGAGAGAAGGGLMSGLGSSFGGLSGLLSGFSGSSKKKQKSTGRQGTDVDFPTQFITDYNRYFGGPFTTGDLFQLAPRPHSLFGNAPTGPVREGGGFNLGFGMPPADFGAESPARQQSGGEPPPPGEQTYRVNDIISAWDEDPEKVMDLDRFFRKSDLDPEGFSREDFEHAVHNLKKWGFSGRSRGNFAEALSLLGSQDELGAAFSGGRGSGIF